MMVRCNAEQCLFLGENCVRRGSFMTYVFVNFIGLYSFMTQLMWSNM
jgi:hypothetical protein